MGRSVDEDMAIKIVAYECGEFVGLAKEIEKQIKALPSAQPEIIRCKDCKWFNTKGCAIKIMDESDKPHEDDFCSFAERTVDAVPVVRCKNCAYHDEVDEHELWCMGNGYPARLVTPDEYCSKGAPK